MAKFDWRRPEKDKKRSGRTQHVASDVWREPGVSPSIPTSRAASAPTSARRSALIPTQRVVHTMQSLPSRVLAAVRPPSWCEAYGQLGSLDGRLVRSSPLRQPLSTGRGAVRGALDAAVRELNRNQSLVANVALVLPSLWGLGSQLTWWSVWLACAGLDHFASELKESAPRLRGLERGLLERWILPAILWSSVRLAERHAYAPDDVERVSAHLQANDVFEWRATFISANRLIKKT